MSSTSSSMVLLLLCVAFYSCIARPIDVIKKETKMAKSSHFSSKNDEKLSNHARLSISSNEEPSIQNKSEAAKEDLSFLMENRVSKNKNQGTRAQKVVEEKDEVKDDENKSPPKVGADYHAVQTGSLATVSWKLPHRKRGEQQPGFNLDYDPPKTHPPVHN